MADATCEYVVQTPEGGWRVAGTRVSLDSVVHAYWQGRTPEAIVAEFPSLDLERVHGSIAFYLRHRADIDDYLAEQARLWESLATARRERDDPLVERVRNAGTVP